MKEIKGIISERFHGVGTVTQEMVRERARENALINGRDPNFYTKDDYLEAKRELTGDCLVEDEEKDFIATLTRWDEAPGFSGHPVQKEEIPDEQTVAQKLVEEGVNEAEHEQRVEGSKKQEME